jgi:hypothetical protein
MNIGGVTHIHLDMEAGDLEALIADPGAFIAARDPNGVVPPLPNGVAVTYEVFSWSKKAPIDNPNVCEGVGGINAGVMCLCTPASIIASDAHFRIYAESA